MNQAIIIFSGYNFRAVISFVRFSVENNIPFFIVARDNEDPIYLTEYKNKVIYKRKSKALSEQLFLSIREILNKLSCGHFFVLPSSEVLNRYLLTKKDFLEKLNFKVPLVQKDIYLLVSEKESFSKLCEVNNIKTPLYKERIPNGFPFVAKPRFYYSTKHNKFLSPYLIFQQSDLEDFRRIEDELDYFYQEYISGESHYLLFYISKTGVTISFGQENLLQQPNGKSIIAARYSDIYQQEIAGKFLELFQKIEFYGFVMVEVKKRENDFFMIEANPRLWGPSQFFLDSGSLIFHQFATDIGFTVDKNKRISKEKLYFWAGGLGCEMERIALHNLDFKDFYYKYYDFLKNDIFLRSDTIEWFLHEIEDKS